ncbi:MAG: hypothetical protein WC495_07030 [Patescibacteria group bacterium]|jgi:hypothetical protein
MDISILLVKGILVLTGAVLCKSSIFTLLIRDRLFTLEDIEVKFLQFILGLILLMVGFLG